jgi:hypothetical protein
VPVIHIDLVLARKAVIILVSVDDAISRRPERLQPHPRHGNHSDRKGTELLSILAALFGSPQNKRVDLDARPNCGLSEAGAPSQPEDRPVCEHSYSFDATSLKGTNKYASVCEYSDAAVCIQYEQSIPNSTEHRSDSIELARTLTAAALNSHDLS